MHTHIKGTLSLWFHTTWSPPCYPCSTSLYDKL